MSKLLWFFVFFIVLAIPCWWMNPNVPEDILLTARCRVFDLRGVLHKVIPGYSCVLNRDGSFVVATRHPYKITYYTPHSEKIWELAEEVHHDQLQNFCGKDTLLALGFEAGEFLGKLTQFDKVIAIDSKSGQLRKTFSVYKHMPEILKVLKERNVPVKNDLVVSHPDQTYFNYPEIGHANGLHSYDNCQQSGDLPEHLVVTLTEFMGVRVVLSINMKDDEINWILVIHEKQIHDAQVFGDKLVVFNNVVNGSSNENQSVIDEWDVKTLKFQRRIEPKGSGFLSQVGGGIYITPNGWYWMSGYNGDMLVINPLNGEIGLRAKLPALNLHGFRVRDVHEFLRNNKM